MVTRMVPIPFTTRSCKIGESLDWAHGQYSAHIAQSEPTDGKLNMHDPNQRIGRLSQHRYLQSRGFDLKISKGPPKIFWEDAPVVQLSRVPASTLKGPAFICLPSSQKSPYFGFKINERADVNHSSGFFVSACHDTQGWSTLPNSLLVERVFFISRLDRVTKRMAFRPLQIPHAVACLAKNSTHAPTSLAIPKTFPLLPYSSLNVHIQVRIVVWRIPLVKVNVCFPNNCTNTCWTNPGTPPQIQPWPPTRIRRIIVQEDLPSAIILTPQPSTRHH
jgi:hypothetical protein